MSANVDTVRAFLEALERGDVDAAAALLDDDAVWINVSLPAVRGRRQIERLSRLGLRAGVRIRIHVHHAGTDEDGVVLTERTDEMALGPVAWRFWVAGRFDLRDGRIVQWRDAFDWLDITVGLVRGVAGAVAPGLNRPFPSPH